MANINLGSFGASVSPEAMQAVRNALQRRAGGDSSPALNQQSTASATPAPLPASPPQGGSGTIAPRGAVSPQAASKADDSESRLIVSALRERLKAISNLGV